MTKVLEHKHIIIRAEVSEPITRRNKAIKFLNRINFLLNEGKFGFEEGLQGNNDLAEQLDKFKLLITSIDSNWIFFNPRCKFLFRTWSSFI